MSIIQMIFGLGFIFVLLFLVIFVALYVFYSLSIKKILEIYGYENTWMAWVPFARDYALVDAALSGIDEIPVFGISVPSVVFKFWWVVTYIISFIPHVGSLLSLIVRIILFGPVVANVYSKVEQKSLEEVKTFAYVSAAIPIIAYIKFISYSNDNQAV